jgi:hypothetical protein
MAGKYLLYVALEQGDGQSDDFDTLDEVVEAVSELTRKTFESGRRLVTFSVGDMELTEIEGNVVEGQWALDQGHNHAGVVLCGPDCPRHESKEN